MKAIWRRIEAWLQSQASDAVFELQPGVSDEQIAQTELAMNLQFPEAMRESYRIHDGSGLLEMFPEGRLMELSDSGGSGVLYEWNTWGRLLNEGKLPEVAIPPEYTIKPVRWNPKWIPLTDNGGQGNHYCVDLDPSPNGKHGQIIWYHHERGAIRVVASGFEEWLSQYADDLEMGKYSLGPELEIHGPWQTM